MKRRTPQCANLMQSQPRMGHPTDKLTLRRTQWKVLIVGLELRWLDVINLDPIPVVDNNLVAVLVTNVQRVSYNFLGVFFGLRLHGDSVAA